MTIYIPQPPKLSWQDGQPESAAYGDIYFSRAGGLEETRHVFINSSDIARRTADSAYLSVCETGFGTGLNFLTCWQEWRRNASANARLNYWAVEKYPLQQTDLQQALSQFPELAEFSNQLLQAYPLPLPGWHSIVFDSGRVSLTLMFDDIAAIMPVFNANIDVWFLDGFAPAKNPDMWCDELFAAMQRLTNKNGCAATFTAAGHVKRNLMAAGFEVEKKSGFGHKRDMLTAKFNGGSAKKLKTPQNATIIGAGLAGCAAAAALANRGVKVKLLDSNKNVGLAASGNPAAILKPHYTADWSYAGQFSTIAFQYAKSFLALNKVASRMDGVLAIDATTDEAERHNKLAAKLGLPENILCKLDAASASDIAATNVRHDALWHPHAGWYRMGDMCQMLSQHENIQFVEMTASTYVDDEVTILANGWGAKEMLPWLPLESVRGQMSMVKASAASANLQTSVHYGGYFSTALDGMHAVGSTFKRHDDGTEIREADTAEVMAKLKNNLPQFSELEVITNFAATRCASRDRMPLAGKAIDKNGDVIEGLYLSLAHGSKGAATCLFAAEIIAAQICGEALPINNNFYNRTMAPSRFTHSHKQAIHKIR